jgi:cardiolipin synthase
MHFDFLQISTLVIAIHLLGLIAAGHAIMSVRTSQGAVAWTIALAALPYFTLIPYLFLGRTRFTGYVRKRRQRNTQMRGDSAEPNWHEMHAQMEIAGVPLHPGIRALSVLTGMPFLPGNKVRLLINGAQTFAAIFAAIDSAKSYVMVQFFIVRDDHLGRSLRDLLIRKSAAGVSIYFLYDGIGSYSLPARYIAELNASGVHVREFATTRRIVNRFQLNFRNHRKTVVVDGQCAFIGGLNVGVEYLGETPPLSPWRDTHIEVCGPAVACIQITFLEDWYWVTQKLPAIEQPRPLKNADMYCQLIPSGPADSQETCSLFFVEAINSARERVWITTPYFVPDESVFAALRLAALRGVQVRILMPSRPDHRVSFEAGLLYAYDAVRAGIEVYRYLPGFMHQKVILIDNVAAAIGTANLDNRSLRLNFELMLLTVDRGFASEVEKMLLTDFSQSKRVHANDYLQAPPWRRFGMHVARLFAPIL